MVKKIIKKSKTNRKYSWHKAIVLILLLLAVSSMTVACKQKDNKSEEDTKLPTPIVDVKPTESPLPTMEPKPTVELEPTVEPEPTMEPTSTVKPTPTVKKPTPTIKPTSPVKKPISIGKVVHSVSVFKDGRNLFYKDGNLKNTKIKYENLNTGKIKDLATIDESYSQSSEFFLKDDNIYYHSKGDIYKVGIDGENRKAVYKGKARILGFHNNEIFILDNKTKEIIKINQKAEKKTIIKMKSIDPLEVIMVDNGIYYINKSSNNKFDGNNPLDRLFFIDFKGENKTEVYNSLDIYDLKTNGENLFFLALSEEPETMEIKKVNNLIVTTIHTLNKDEIAEEGIEWIDRNTFTLLGVNKSTVYYGIYPTKIYSVSTSGKGNSLFLEGSKIKDINGSAYFMRGDIDGNYLKIIFDCDEDPVETYLIDLQDQSTIKFDGGYYKSSSIDVEGEYVYYCKSSQYDRYGEIPDKYKYNKRKLK